jgi:hypothetical protein
MNGLMPLTTTSTELQRHYKRVVRLAKRTKQPITVLSQNKPTLLVMDPSAYPPTPSSSLSKKDPYGMFADSTITDADIDDVIHEWDRHVEKLVNDL